MRPVYFRACLFTLAVLCGSMAALQAQEGRGLLDLLGLGGKTVDEVEIEYADPEAVMAWVELPRTAKVGDEMTLTIEIENGRAEKPLRLSGLEVEETFLEGFTLVSVAPEPRQQGRSFGYLSLEYPVDIAAGKSVKYELKLQAKEPGIYIGDVDVHEGKRWLSRAAQIRITE
ncbi:MAG: hypothetical protein KF861_09830 [Planctomycetaceae bacterium]|nr:hypothetical protein [Planctomycetaceae bacterium]